jgi:pyridoxal phosphate enzyme (YggS family)
VALGRELDRRASTSGRRLRVLVQVNVSGEGQKAGVPPEAVEGILAASAEWPHIEVAGLMAIPAAGEPEEARPAFAQLRGLRDRLRRSPGNGNLRELSMGMSGDFEVAIEEGATIVRVGTAVFGPRAD